jgi:hypothetical protein
MEQPNQLPRFADNTQKLAEMEQRNPEIFRLASFLGARNELFYVLRRRKWDQKSAEIALSLKSWKELSEFIQKENIGEAEQLDSEQLIEAWFDLLAKNPSLNEEYSDINLEER